MAPFGRPEEVQKRNAFGKARLAQSVERLALNQVVVGSSPTVGDHLFVFCCSCAIDAGVLEFYILHIT